MAFARGLAAVFKRSKAKQTAEQIKAVVIDFEKRNQQIHRAIALRYGNAAWVKKQAFTTQPIDAKDILPSLSLNGKTPSDLVHAAQKNAHGLQMFTFMLDRDVSDYYDKVGKVLKEAHRSEHFGSTDLAESVLKSVQAIPYSTEIRKMDGYDLLGLYGDKSEDSTLPALTAAQVLELAKSLQLIAKSIEELLELKYHYEKGEEMAFLEVIDLKDLSGDTDNKTWDAITHDIQPLYDGQTLPLHIDYLIRRQLLVAHALAVYMDRSMQIKEGASMESHEDIALVDLWDVAVPSNEGIFTERLRKENVVAGVVTVATLAVATAQIVTSLRQIFGPRKRKAKGGMRGSSKAFANAPAEDKAVIKEREDDLKRASLKLDEVLVKYYTNTSWLADKRLVVGTVDAADISTSLTVKGRMPFAIAPAVRASASELHGYSNVFLEVTKAYCDQLVKAATPGSAIKVADVKAPDYASGFHGALMGSHAFSEYDSPSIHLNKTGMVPTLPALERRDIVTLGQAMIKLSEAITGTGQRLAEVGELFSDTVEAQLVKVGASDADKAAVHAALDRHPPRILENMLAASAATLTACATYIDRSIKKADE